MREGEIKMSKEERRMSYFGVGNTANSPPSYLGRW